MRSTLIFDSFGPYHQARVRAAARVTRLTALQVSGRSADYAWNNEARAEGFELVTLFPGGTSREASTREIIQRVQRALDDSGPEVVFIPGWSSCAALAALDWCLRRQIPSVVMSESTAWDEKRVAWKELIKHRLVTLFSAALVGGHPHATYAEQLGLTQDRIVCGYDVVDNAYFRQHADQARAQETKVRETYGLPDNYFLASARFIGKKNLSNLLQAYAKYRALCGSISPWSLVLLGDGLLRDSLEEQIQRTNLKEHVLLPGFRQYPDLPAYYAGANLFIHPSTVEPWGLVVNEAMASGLPVLVSDRCGCASDLVQNGRNGFTFDPTNVDELANLMFQVFSMPSDTRKAMGQESHNIIAQWSPGRFAEALQQSARTAMAAGPIRKVTALDRVLLRGLMRR